MGRKVLVAQRGLWTGWRLPLPEVRNAVWINPPAAEVQTRSSDDRGVSPA